MSIAEKLTKKWDRTWLAPAKLNLFLHVVGRRADGYHALQTVFQLIDYHDSVVFEPRADDRIVLATPLPGVDNESNLSVRAARALRAYCPEACGVTIHLTKRIPMGAGLGGGSSDAATVLLALNDLWDVALSRKSLCTLGLTLGADVPVFVAGHNAFAQGVGEQLMPLSLPEYWYVVLIPDVHVSTADVFKSADLPRDTPLISPTTWTIGQGHNDLQDVVCRHYPAVQAALVYLKQYGDARMTGSGACVFLACLSEVHAQRIVRACSRDGWQAFACAGLAQHPLA